MIISSLLLVRMCVCVCIHMPLKLSLSNKPLCVACFYRSTETDGSMFSTVMVLTMPPPSCECGLRPRMFHRTILCLFIWVRCMGLCVCVCLILMNPVTKPACRFLRNFVRAQHNVRPLRPVKIQSPEWLVAAFQTPVSDSNTLWPRDTADSCAPKPITHIHKFCFKNTGRESRFWQVSRF